MRSLLCLFAVPFLFISTTNALATPQPVREWTFLVYINGNNNLDSYGAVNINEMEQVGSNENVNVVVQWASLEGGTHRLFVQKDNDPTKVTSPVVDEPGNNVDMGDWRTLVEFVRWGVANYPAKHYFIDVWDHGSGWHLKTAMDGGMRPKDISWDDKSHNYMKTEQLADAMAEAAKIIGHKVDIYGSDACLMGMAEVADQMSDSVEYFVGSEEVEPLAGWPYDALLRFWAGGKRTASEVASTLVREYVKSYQGGSHGTSEVTLSAFNLSKLDGLNRAVHGFGQELSRLDKTARAKIMEGSQATQRFSYSDYADLGDFLDKVEKAEVREISRATLGEVRKAAGEFVIANATTKNYANAKGVAMWIPNYQSTYNSYKDRYNAMRFNAHTDWSHALSVLLQDDSSIFSSM